MTAIVPPVLVRQDQPAKDPLVGQGLRGLGRQVSLRTPVGKAVKVRLPARTRITVAVRPAVGERVLPRVLLIRRAVV